MHVFRAAAIVYVMKILIVFQRAIPVKEILFKDPYRRARFLKSFHVANFICLSVIRATLADFSVTSTPVQKLAYQLFNKCT